MSAKKQETVWQFPDVRSWCGIVFADYGNPLYYAQHLYVGDKEVTDLTIPDDVTTINGRAFNGFAALKSVHIGKGVKTIGSYAFAWCSSLTSIILPDNIESMGSYVFTEDTCLKRGTLEELPDDRKQDVREMQSPTDDCNLLVSAKTSAFACAYVCMCFFNKSGLIPLWIQPF